MSAPIGVVLQPKRDDFSYQVYAASDQRFWFRLVRERDRDVITDFFLGSFAKQDSAALLDQCYRVLDLSPKMTVVFTDILAGKDVTSELLQEAQEFYTQAGTSLLTSFGAKSVDSFVEESRGKLNLVLAGRQAVLQ